MKGPVPQNRPPGSFDVIVLVAVSVVVGRCRSSLRHPLSVRWGLASLVEPKFLRDAESYLSPGFASMGLVVGSRRIEIHGSQVVALFGVRIFVIRRCYAIDLDGGFEPWNIVATSASSATERPQRPAHCPSILARSTRAVRGRLWVGRGRGTMLLRMP